MDRLTGKRRTPRGAVPAAFSIDFIFEMEADEVAGFFETMNRLADYEDTGLTPAEVMELKAENKELSGRLERVRVAAMP